MTKINPCVSTYQTIRSRLILDVQGTAKSNPYLRASVVVSPQRSNLVLATNIPNIEFHVLVRNGLNVESDGRNSCYALVQLQLVKDGYSRRHVSVPFALLDERDYN
jgi:hypothetical protein